MGRYLPSAASKFLLFTQTALRRHSAAMPLSMHSTRPTPAFAGTGSPTASDDKSHDSRCSLRICAAVSKSCATIRHATWKLPERECINFASAESTTKPPLGRARSLALEVHRGHAVRGEGVRDFDA